MFNLQLLEELNHRLGVYRQELDQVSRNRVILLQWWIYCVHEEVQVFTSYINDSTIKNTKKLLKLDNQTEEE